MTKLKAKLATYLKENKLNTNVVVKQQVKIIL